MPRVMRLRCTVQLSNEAVTQLPDERLDRYGKTSDLTGSALLSVQRL